MKKKVFATIKILLLIFAVWLVLTPNIDTPRVLAQFSWTDNIEIYKDITVEYTNIRTITNNETFVIDVKVYVDYTSRIDLLEYYKLSANGTDFVIISNGVITQSENTYYGLQPGQKLVFSVRAKPTSSITVGDVVTVGLKVELHESTAYIHDVAVVSVTLSTDKVYVGQIVNITVVVRNEGTSLLPESFNVTAYYACVDTAIETKTVTNLASGENTTLTFSWDTTGVIPNANYTIKAKASVVPGETDTGDNTYEDGTVKVKPLGDANGDGWIDGMDLTIMGFAWGARGPEWPNYNKDVDFNLDGMIDGLDLTILGMYWRYFYTEVIYHAVPWGEVTYYVVTESNSTVSDFYFNQPSKEIGFNVTGPCNTTGFASVLIPNELLGGPYTVFIDGVPITPIIWGNTTHTELYFTYSLPPNPRKVQIFGTTVIPSQGSDVWDNIYVVASEQRKALTNLKA